MRLLIVKASLILTIAVCAAGCGHRGPLTPEEAFQSLKKAFHRNDAHAVIALLSGKSLEKISHAAAMIARMNPEQRSLLAEKLEIHHESLDSLTPESYLKLQFAMGKHFNENIIGPATSLNITGTSIKGNRAVITVENGMQLTFVKEGPYWKFDMSEM